MVIRACETVITAWGTFASTCTPGVSTWWNAYVVPTAWSAYSWGHPHLHHWHSWWR